MYRMVIDTLNEYQPVWEGTPKFVDALSLFSSKFEQLQFHAERSRAYTLGVKESRDSLRADVAGLGIQISSALTALGAERGDLELIAQMRITENQLLKFSHSDVIILLDRILGNITGNEEDLIQFGISEEVINAFQTKRDELMVTIMAPRKAIMKRKDSSQQILALCEEMDNLLKYKLDRLVRVLRPNSESLFTEYQAARMILDYGHGAPRGEQAESDEY